MNYNGRKHLEACLSSALEAARAYGEPCPVVVLDNQSTDPDAAFIRGRFPEVRVEPAPANDILFSYNWLLPRMEEEIILILNNDMRFDRDFIRPLIGHFRDPEVFAVTARVKNWEGTQVTTGRRLGYFHHFWFYKKWEFDVRKPCLTLDAGGGCAAFRRDRVLELGGFDTLFRPGYSEDTDLSYRAWQRGWKVVYEPASVIYHKIGATLGDMLSGDEGRTRLIRRNEVLFAVKNCGGTAFLAGYLLFLPFRALRSFFSNRPLTRGILDALPRIPAALAARFREGPKKAVRDKEFLRRIQNERAFS